LDDEFLTHRERVAEAPTTRRIANALLGLSSTKFPHLAILAGRFVADASPTRHRRIRCHADPATMAYRRYDSYALLTRRERVTYSTRRRRVADATPTRRERADDAMPTRREYLVRIGIIISRDNI